MEDTEERRTGVEQLVPNKATYPPLRTIMICCACVAMSGKPRPDSLHKLQSKKRSDRVAATDALVEAVMLVAKVVEEGGHDLVLVLWALKIVREAAAGGFP